MRSWPYQNLQKKSKNLKKMYKKIIRRRVHSPTWWTPEFSDTLQLWFLLWKSYKIQFDHKRHFYAMSRYESGTDGKFKNFSFISERIFYQWNNLSNPKLLDTFLPMSKLKKTQNRYKKSSDGVFLFKHIVLPQIISGSDFVQIRVWLN